MACEVANGVMIYVNYPNDETRVVWAQSARFVDNADAVSFRCEGLWVDVSVPGTSEAAVMSALSTARAQAPATHPINPRINRREVIHV